MRFFVPVPSAATVLIASVRMNGSLPAMACAWLLVFGVTSASAAEVAVPVHGRLASSSGGPVADGSYPMVFALYDSEKAAKPLWQEKAVAVKVQGGAFFWRLGPAALLKLEDTVFTSHQETWMGVAIAGEQELARAPVDATPRAVYATGAGWAGKLQCSGCVDAGHIAAASIQPSHLSFAYAGSTTKGGPATSAETAKSADTAKTALAADTAKVADLAKLANNAKSADSAKTADTAGNAKTADAAKTAQTATSATTAEVAKALQCTGCVTSVQLDGGVPAFIFKTPKPLGADLDFSAHQALNMRIHNAATNPAACDANKVGMVYYNTAKNALMLCNGKAFVAFAFAFDPGTKENPASSCQSLYDDGHKTNGYYWLQLGTATVQAYCDQQTDGGGWTRVMSAQWKHFFSGSNWDNLNAAAPTDNNYSILNHRTNLTANGTWTLRFTVGNSGTWPAGGRAHTTVWKQKHDPFTQTTNGADYTHISGEKSSTCGGFNGLHNKYQGHGMTSDPDSGDSVGCWWMQVVPTKDYDNKGYLEGYGGSGNYHTWQVLWMR